MTKETPGAGHNTDPDRLRGFVERLERLETEKRDAMVGIKDVYEEVRAALGGKAVAPLRVVIRERMETAEQAEKRRAKENDADEMRARLGMIADMPLGEAAVARAGR